MEHEHIRELLDRYVVGVLAEGERELVERHLATGCAECSEVVVDLSVAAESMLNLNELELPPQRLKEAVLARIDAVITATPHSSQVPPASVSADDYREASHNLLKLAGVAAALAACMLLALGSWWYNSISQQREQLAADNAIALRAMQSRIAQTESILDASRFKTIGLDVKPANGGPVNHILYDELSRELHLWVATVANQQTFDAVRILSSQGEVIAQKHLSGGVDYRSVVVPLDSLPPRGTLELGDFVDQNGEVSDDDLSFVAKQRIEFSIHTSE